MYIFNLNKDEYLWITRYDDKNSIFGKPVHLIMTNRTFIDFMNYL
jgi:hypothetical protein